MLTLHSVVKYQSVLSSRVTGFCGTIIFLVEVCMAAVFQIREIVDDDIADVVALPG
jgi:hypothetical protein